MIRIKWTGRNKRRWDLTIDFFILVLSWFILMTSDPEMDPPWMNHGESRDSPSDPILLIQSWN